MERVIFDLDYTLLKAHWDEEKEFFRKRLGDNEKAKEFIEDVGFVLAEYERSHHAVDIFSLNKFMNKKGYNFTEELVYDWVKFSKDNLTDDICDGVIELLDMLKDNNLKMSVSTNWFTEAQTGRLKRAGILDYFDRVIGGDYFLKPGKVNFFLAANSTPHDKCIVIGDDYINDYIGAINADMSAIYLHDNYKIPELVEQLKENDCKIKRLVKKR